MRWILACALLFGCAGIPTKSARIAHSCSALPAQNTGFARAYIELASVKKGDLPRSLAKLKQEPIQVQQEVTGVLVEHETPVALPWDRCLDAKCEYKLARTLLITAYLPKTTQEPVHLEIMIREGVGEHASLFTERVDTYNQQPARLDEHGDRSWLIATPYLLSNDADVQRLIACKQP
ncbi:MAG TPA: hypothetical protein VI299_22885 [Polyangiales bacterium]